MATTTISPKRLAELRDNGHTIDVIDVRTPVEFRAVHVDIARNIPLDRLDPAAVMQARNGAHNEPLYFICGKGERGNRPATNSHRRATTTWRMWKVARRPGMKPDCRWSAGRKPSLLNGKSASRPVSWCWWASSLAG